MRTVRGLDITGDMIRTVRGLDITGDMIRTIANTAGNAGISYWSE